MQDEQPDVATVSAWHDAVNSRDEQALRTLTTSDVIMIGPRGSADGERGHQVLVEWMERSGIRLEPVSHVVVDGAVIVEEDATWPNDPVTHRLATVFEMRDGLIAGIQRFPSLQEALAERPA